MKNGKQIIEENIGVYTPNAGIIALAKMAYDDPDGFCVDDGDDCFSTSYRCDCLDRGACHRPDFMLACISARNPAWQSLGNKAVRIYNEAMEESK